MKTFLETFLIIMAVAFMIVATINLIGSIRQRNQAGITGWMCAIIWASISLMSYLMK